MMIKSVLKALGGIATFIVTLGTTGVTAFAVYVLLGYLQEKIVESFNLSNTGSAYTGIQAMMTIIFAGISAILIIVNIAVGLYTLAVVLEVFGFKFSFGRKV
jgi:hypothetical protein